MSFEACGFMTVLLAQGKVHCKNPFFFEMGSLHFETFLPLAGRSKNGSLFKILGKLKWARGPSEDQGRPISGRQVFSVCGAVCVCGGCHGVSNDVLNDVFFALCL